MKNKVRFTGSISTVTPDGRSGIVTLDHEIAGNAYAVISPKTNGRITLMNGRGALHPGTKVAGEATVGPDALRAVSVYGVDGNQQSSFGALSPLSFEGAFV
jgi:hypothetical protein